MKRCTPLGPVRSDSAKIHKYEKFELQLAFLEAKESKPRPADKLLVARLMPCIIFPHLSIVNASGPRPQQNALQEQQDNTLGAWPFTFSVSSKFQASSSYLSPAPHCSLISHFPALSLTFFNLMMRTAHLRQQRAAGLEAGRESRPFLSLLMATVVGQGNFIFILMTVCLMHVRYDHIYKPSACRLIT